MKTTSSLSVIMPALNEENNIANAIHSTMASFEKYKIRGDIIVVNDGSTDGTRTVVERIMESCPNLRLVNHESREGIGKSFLDGVRNSVMDVVVLLPGDNELSAEDTLSFFKIMDHVDIIVPFVHNVEVREFSRRLISAVYRFIINKSFALNLNYTNGSVFYRRCILSSTLAQVKSFGFFYQAELLVRLIRKGYLFAEVPNFLSLRKSGRSKAISARSLLDVIRCFLRLFVEMNFLRSFSRDPNQSHPDSITFKKYHAHVIEDSAAIEETAPIGIRRAGGSNR